MKKGMIYCVMLLSLCWLLLLSNEGKADQFGVVDSGRSDVSEGGYFFKLENIDKKIPDRKYPGKNPKGDNKKIPTDSIKKPDVVCQSLDCPVIDNKRSFIDKPDKPITAAKEKAKVTVETIEVTTPDGRTIKKFKPNDNPEESITSIELTKPLLMTKPKPRNPGPGKPKDPEQKPKPKPVNYLQYLGWEK